MKLLDIQTFGLVPTTRKINGQSLDQDITINVNSNFISNILKYNDSLNTFTPYTNKTEVGDTLGFFLGGTVSDTTSTSKILSLNGSLIAGSSSNSVNGISGNSYGGDGVIGNSNSGRGIVGISWGNYGVYGQAGNSGGAGVGGIGTNGAPGGIFTNLVTGGDIVLFKGTSNVLKAKIDTDGNYIRPGLYGLPTTAGNAGQVLTSAGIGNNFVWSTPSNGGSDTSKIFQILSSTSNITFDTSISKNAKVILTSNATLTLTNLTNGLEGNIIVKQDSTGNRTLTIIPTPKVINNGSGNIGLSIYGNYIDIISYIYDGTTLFINYGKNYN